MNNPNFSNLGLCAASCAHCMCHHKLWPASVSHPFSSLNSSLGFAGEKHYQKITIPIFSCSKFCYSRSLPLYCSYFLFISVISFVDLVIMQSSSNIQFEINRSLPYMSLAQYKESYLSSHIGLEHLKNILLLL